MPRPRDPGAKIWGPSELSDGRFRVTVRDRSGGRSAHTFKTRRLADKFISRLEAEESERPDTVAAALERYRGHLTSKGNKPKPIDLTIYRIGRILGEVLEKDLASLTTKILRQSYERFIINGRVTPAELAARRAGLPMPIIVERKPLSADTHRNCLAEARSFLRWCVLQEWIPENPLEDVEGKGKRRHGKAQLRINEARKFRTVALIRARDPRHPQHDGAVAALIALFMGLRATEITNLCARDLDDSGRVLWVDDKDTDAHEWSTKTDKSRRSLDVPKVLQPILLAQARGREGGALLFPTEVWRDGKYVVGPHWRDWPREQIGALCQAAGVPRVTAHGMRGVVVSIAADRGTIGKVVADALGHEDYSTSEQSYARPGAAEEARRRKGLEVLEDEERGAD